MSINKTWHKQNRMPTNATLPQRIAWHKAHAAACQCRPMPASIVEAIKLQQLKTE